MTPRRLHDLLLAILAVLAAGACTRIVDLDVEEGPRLLVVEGRVELGAPLQRVRLTTTDVASSDTAPPRATGALVEIGDELGTRHALFESAPGLYETGDLIPRVGGTYTLRVTWQGERYEAVTDLVGGPPIDSLYFVYVEEGLAQGDSGYRAVIDYTDPPGVPNWYLWELWVNGVRRVAIDPGNRFRVISSDEYYDGGRVVGYQPFDEEVVDPGDAVTLRQIAMTEPAYRYWFTLFEQTAPGGGPFSTPPASLRGNVANLTDPGHRALGWFLAGEVHERTGIVPPR